MTNCWWSECFRPEKIKYEQQFFGRKCHVDVEGQRRMAALVPDDRKAKKLPRFAKIVSRLTLGP